MTAFSSERLAEVFVEIADTLVDEFDLIEFLQLLTAHTSGLVDARAAGLLLADQDGHLRPMAASDERAHMLELFQVQALEGPCFDCFRQGVPIVNVDLMQATSRWPQFAPRAVAAGYRSVQAFPMRLRREVIGALNLFGSEEGQLDDSDARVVQALADVATIGILQERAIRQGEALSAQLQGALDSRIVIEQAKGVLAQLRGTSPDQAFELMRAYCRSNNLRLGDVAQALVDNPLGLPALTSP